MNHSKTSNAQIYRSIFSISNDESDVFRPISIDLVVMKEEGH